MSGPESSNRDRLDQIDPNPGENLDETGESLLSAAETSGAYTLYYDTNSLCNALQRDLGDAEAGTLELNEEVLAAYELRVLELEGNVRNIAILNNLDRVNGEYPRDLVVTEGDIEINMHDLELNIDDFNNTLADARDRLNERTSAIDALGSSDAADEATRVVDAVADGTITTAAGASAAITSAEAVTQGDETPDSKNVWEQLVDLLKEFFSFFNNDETDESDEDESSSENDPDSNAEGTQLTLTNSWLSGSYERYPAVNPFPVPVETRSAEFEGREPSGIVHVARFNCFFMVDDSGEILRLSEDYTIEKTWRIGGDLEGITYDPVANVFYVIEEGSQTLKMLSYVNGDLKLTGDEWDLSSIIPYNNDRKGVEALTFANGKFYVGDQHNGNIHVINISGGNISEIDVIEPPVGVTYDVADLYYEKDSGLIYAVYDADNRLALIDSRTNTFVAQFELPESSTNQEGITIDAEGNMHIAEDSGAVREYTAG